MQKTQVPIIAVITVTAVTRARIKLKLAGEFVTFEGRE